METKDFVRKKLREFRKSRRMSLKQIARIVGVTTGAMSHYETGKREIDIGKLNDICIFFDMDISYFLPPKKTIKSVGVDLDKHLPAPSS